jgi:predicted dinucleotide-binding enzyme
MTHETMLSQAQALLDQARKAHEATIDVFFSGAAEPAKLTAMREAQSLRCSLAELVGRLRATETVERMARGVGFRWRGAGAGLRMG